MSLTAPLAGLRQARSLAALVRWLGPWTSDSRVPTGTVRTPMLIDGSRGPYRALLYRPLRREATGTYVISPGLQPRGADDPRMDRFARVLARAGFVVLVPALPDHVDLRVSPQATDDLAAAFDRAEQLPNRAAGRPAVVAVSFGCLPALRLAARARYAHRISKLIVFGGYANWRSTLAFCFRGEDCRDHPVAFINVVEDLPGAPADPAQLRSLWRRFALSTWGHLSMRAPHRYRAQAEQLACELPNDQRDLFLIGCGARPGGYQLILKALERGAVHGTSIDPRAGLEGLRCPVHLVHGRNDDVIPCSQLQELASAMPACITTSCYLTGLFGHSGAVGIRQLAHGISSLPGELRTMAGVMAALGTP